MKTIDVAMVTWPNHPKRLEYFRRTLQSVRENLTASGHGLRFYCSAESQRDPKSTWHGPELIALCEEAGVELRWRDEPANLGANMNAAMRMGDGEFIFLQQDDWMLLYPLDLSPGADLLAGHEKLDIVRYSWPEAEYMHPTFTDGPGGFRAIDPLGKWPYGDDPHLRRRDFMDRWGWYYDKGGHGTASGKLMDKLARGGAGIAAADKNYYQHIGYATAVLDDTRAGGKRRYECTGA